MSTKKEGGRTHLVAGEWVAVVLVAYQALFGRVELGGVSGQVRVLLVRSYEEKRCILARCDTVRRDRAALALANAKRKGGRERRHGLEYVDADKWLIARGLGRALGFFGTETELAVGCILAPGDGHNTAFLFVWS